MTKENKKIELWDGYKVEVNVDLADDLDFMSDYLDAQKNNDLKLLMQCFFGLIGGDKVAQDVRDHIVAKKGHYSINELTKLMQKVDQSLPKAGQGA